MMILNEQFKLGDIVYLKSDPDQLLRVVCGIMVRPGGVNMYYLSCGLDETAHYDLEITADRNILITL